MYFNPTGFGLWVTGCLFLVLDLVSDALFYNILGWIGLVVVGLVLVLSINKEMRG